MHISSLLYGFAGAGKSYLATSALWDHEKQDFLRRGYWVTFGRESNQSIEMPEITLKEANDSGWTKPGHVRLVSPSADSVGFANDFEKFGRAVHSANTKAIKDGKEPPVEAVVLDGLSEFDLLFETGFDAEQGTGNKYAKWDALMAKFFGMMQILDPEEIHAQVIVTARVRAKDEGSPQPWDYIPSVRGQFKTYLPHYFNLVTYMNTITRPEQRDGKRVPVTTHRAHMLPEGNEFQIKNNWEKQWTAASQPAVLDNPTFSQILNVIGSFKKPQGKSS